MSTNHVVNVIIKPVRMCVISLNDKVKSSDHFYNNNNKNYQNLC